jgi:hypothetical protein
MESGSSGAADAVEEIGEQLSAVGLLVVLDGWGLMKRWAPISGFDPGRRRGKWLVVDDNDFVFVLETAANFATLLDLGSTARADLESAIVVLLPPRRAYSPPSWRPRPDRRSPRPVCRSWRRLTEATVLGGRTAVGPPTRPSAGSRQRRRAHPTWVRQ